MYQNEKSCINFEILFSLSVSAGKNFTREASNVTLDLMADEDTEVSDICSTVVGSKPVEVLFIRDKSNVFG